MVVQQLVMMMFVAVGDVNHLLFQVDALDVTVKYADSLQQFSNGADDMRDIKVARRHLVEHRREEEKVLAIYDRDFNIRVFCQALLKVKGRVKPAKSAAEYQYSCLAHNVNRTIAAVAGVIPLKKVGIKAVRSLIDGMNRKVTIRQDWRYRMTTLKNIPTKFKLDRSPITLADRQAPNSKDTAEFSRFKAQLKRAVASEEAPQYLIDAIKTAIRS